MFKLSFTLAVLLSLTAIAATALAQQSTVTATNTGVNDGFFENFGVGFGAGFLPQVGGNAAGGANFAGGGFNINAGQGSTRGMTSSSASVTGLDGYPASITAQTLRPFVLGFIPVVGNLPGGGVGQFGLANQQPALVQSQTGLQQRLAGGAGAFKPPAAAAQPPVAHSAANPVAAANPALAPDDPIAARFLAAAHSSAGRAAAGSIAAIAQQQAEQEAAHAGEIQSLLDQGRMAQTAGKPNVARLYYQQAARHATGPLKEQAEANLRSLGESASAR